MLAEIITLIGLYENERFIVIIFYISFFFNLKSRVKNEIFIYKRD